MKKLDKEALMNYGTYAAGCFLIVHALIRKGAYDAIKSINQSGVSLFDQNGNKVTFSLPSRNPFKK